MTRPINHNTEKIFLKLVSEGKFIVNKNGSVYNTKTNRYLGLKPNGAGYGNIGVKIDGKTINIQLHRLVFLVHGGILTEEFPLVNHIDGNKMNNRFENLEASNNSSNVKHAYDTGLHVVSDKTRKDRSMRLSGENGPSAKLTDEQAKEIRTRYKNEKISHRKLAEEYNVSHKRIGEILRNQTFKNVI